MLTLSVLNVEKWPIWALLTGSKNNVTSHVQTARISNYQVYFNVGWNNIIQYKLLQSCFLSTDAMTCTLPSKQTGSTSVWLSNPFWNQPAFWLTEHSGLL